MRRYVKICPIAIGRDPGTGEIPPEMD